MPPGILDQPPYDDDSGDDGFNPDDMDDAVDLRDVPPDDHDVTWDDV